MQTRQTLPIRIWHQSFTVLSDLGTYDAALKEHFKRVARPETDIVMHGMQPGTYQTNYPGSDIRHVGLQYLHSIQFVKAGLVAQQGLRAKVRWFRKCPRWGAGSIKRGYWLAAIWGSLKSVTQF